MRYSSLSVIACTFLLAACSRQAGLPAQDVLKRSSVANSGLISAHIMVTARMTATDVTTGSVDASGIIEGNMQQGGNQLDVVFNTSGVRTSMDQSLTWNADGRLIVLSPQESYVMLEQLETSPVLPLPALDDASEFLNAWFRLPSVESAPPTLTPDPRLLRLQSDAVRVVKDRGIGTMDGKSMYHYDVAIDPQRLAAYLAETLPEGESSTTDSLLQQLSAYNAEGELWIDAETFLLTKAVWNIAMNEKTAPMLTISMSISKPGQQVNVTAPSTSKPFPALSVFPAGATVLQEF